MMRALRSLLFFAVVMAGAGAARAQVVANFVASPATGCAPLVVNFTNTSTGAASYSWNFGNSNTSTIASPSATYTSAGSYTVTLTATGPGGSNTKTGTITVHSPPTVTFGASPSVGCAPLTVSFTNSSTANMTPSTLTYLWNFGNGQSSTQATPTYTYTSTGPFQVTLAATNAAGCVTTIAIPALVTVNPKPAVAFSAATTTYCGAPATVSFSNTSAGAGALQYAWTFGDGNTSTSATPTHTYMATGNYTVRLIVTDANGCVDTLTKPSYIHVVPVPNASFTAPTSVCQGSSAQFVATGTPAGGTNDWIFGNGSGMYSGSTINYTYPAAGTFTVTNIYTVNGCADTATATITVQAAPVPSFTISPPIACPPPNAQVTFTNTTSGGTSYLWNFGDGNSSVSTSPTHSYNAFGQYNITLTATNAAGCSATATVPAGVWVAPLIADVFASPVSGCVPLTVDFAPAALTVQNGNPAVYPLPMSSFLWDFGDGSPTSTLDSPTHTYVDTGFFTVTLVVTTANGCTDTVQTYVAVGRPPTVGFTAAPLNVCVRELVSFTNTTVGAHTYTWSASGSFFSNAQHPVHPFQTADTFDIKLVASHYGCVDSLTIPDYIIVRGPEAKAEIKYSCDTPRFVKFTNKTLVYDSVRWYFGDGTTTTNPSPNHLYPALGTYNASLVAWSAATGCKDSVNFPIRLFDYVPNFLTNDSAVCVGDTVTLTQSVTRLPVTAGPPVSYRWTIGNVQLTDTTLPVVKVTMPTRGYYAVRLVIGDERGCKDTIIKNNHLLFSKPYAHLAASPLNACIPANTFFIDSTSYTPGTFGVSRFWDFGDGSLLGGNNPSPSHSYAFPGLMTITLAVTDNIGCSDTAVRPAYVSVEDPTAGIQGPSQACAGATVSLLDGSLGNNLTYNWSFGNGQTSTLQNPSVVYTVAGTYTIRLIVNTVAGCPDTAFKTITIHPQPQASFTVSDSFAICTPHLVQFTNTTPGNHLWQWNLGSGFSTLHSPSHVYATPGQYTIELIAISSPAGCRDTATATVTVLGFPGALSYGPSLLGCAPLTVNFSHTVQNVPSFVFDFADGTTFGTTGNTATHTYLTPGKYVPRLIMSDNQGCSSTSFGLDTIKVDGAISGFTYSPNPACDRGTFTLVDTSRGLFSTITSRTWILSGGVVTTVASPVQTYNAPGVYPVTLINVTSTGCRDTLHGAITVTASPTVSAGQDTVICVGDAATLKPSGAVTYTWSPGATLSCTTCTNPQALPTAPTSYIVTGRDAVGCTDTDTVLVGLKTKAGGAVGPGGTICRKDTVRLYASGGQTYQWIPAAGLSNPAIASPVASPDTSTTYTVIIREGSCIADTQKVRVVINPLPGVDAGPDRTIVAGTSTQLNATTTASPVQLRWSPDADLSCATCPDPEASPKRTTVYTVVAKTDKGCVDSSDVQVTVICQQNQLYVPNTFTPNGDGENDRFYPRGRGIDRINRFRIYDRWGALIYEARDVQANDESTAWDGTVNGVTAPPDVFVFIIEGTCDTGEQFKWQGDIALIR